MEDKLIQTLQDILNRAVESGEECGCQLTVYRHGKVVCDLVSGYTDESKTAPVSVQTLFPVFSVGKGIITTLLHICHEKGIFDYDDPVTRYWQEYGANAKSETKVWHIMSHRAGLYDFPENFPLYDRFNWEKATETMAGMAPLDKIGGKHHYHAYTYGLLTGRFLEKAAGRPLRDMLKEMILDPLQISDFFYGIPDNRIRDLAKLVPYTDPAGKIHTEDERLTHNAMQILQGLNPSSNAVANAHSLAKFYASLIETGTNGIRLLKQDTLEQALILRRSPDDPVLGNGWDKFGLGYALCGPEAPWNRMFGHGGACGSEGFADRETGYAVGFTKNKLNATHPDHPTRNEISRALGIPVRIW